MKCRITYRVDGKPGRVELDAKSTRAAIDEWLRTLPEGVLVAASVRVLVPVEIVQ